VGAADYRESYPCSRSLQAFVEWRNNYSIIYSTEPLPLSRQLRLTPLRRSASRWLVCQRPPPLTLFRINTCKSVSKQRTLTPFRMNTYKKRGRGVEGRSVQTGRILTERPGASLTPVHGQEPLRSRSDLEPCLPLTVAKSDELTPMQSHSCKKPPGGECEIQSHTPAGMVPAHGSAR
jgi:hypothetical protein